MRRREFISLTACAAATLSVCPLPAGAQQAKPVIGYLGATSRDKDKRVLTAFHQGLKDQGFAEGQNVAIEYRWAEGRYDLLSALAAELVRQKVTVMFVPSSTPGALAAKGASSDIPIVFTLGSDPVAAGLVASLAKPGANVTGVSILVNLLSAKRLELLHTLLPDARTFAVLLNPKTPNAWPDLKETETAARALGLELKIFNASTEHEIDMAFDGMTKERTGGVFVIADGFFRNQYEQLVTLAARHAVAVIYPWPEFAELGGLICYGASGTEAWRQGGSYVGRILKGEKPADLPVMQATKIELVLNLKTARVLGLEIPARLLALADGVVE
jgi:putative tryptophan/tyrosine transport system substrate-binding protein